MTCLNFLFNGTSLFKVFTPIIPFVILHLAIVIPFVVYNCCDLLHKQIDVQICTTANDQLGCKNSITFGAGVTNGSVHNQVAVHLAYCPIWFKQKTSCIRCKYVLESSRDYPWEMLFWLPYFDFCWPQMTFELPHKQQFCNMGYYIQSPSSARDIMETLARKGSNPSNALPL